MTLKDQSFSRRASAIATMASVASLSLPERKHWWLRNSKIVEKYIKDARALIATNEQGDIASAINLLDAALALSPRVEQALELKARSLLLLRRFRDVADMLQDYIPSLRVASDDPASPSSSSLSDNNSSTTTHNSNTNNSSRESVKLLPNSSVDSVADRDSFKCFSVSDLKKKVMSTLCKTCDKEGQWRYLVLGQACVQLGLMEDAMVLLQTGKRLANAALRQESICRSDDGFSSATFGCSGGDPSAGPLDASDSAESVARLLAHIKLLLRRRAAALAALEGGLHSEAIRHFTKIVDGRRGAPQGFLAECYTHRAAAYRAAGRMAESIADCNRTLALEPSCIGALSTRASLLEAIRCLPDCLHDLEHLKLLYNSVLRDRKLPGPAWKRHDVTYREIPGKLCVLTAKIQELKKRVAGGDTGNVDYYALIGLRRGCSRSELERAHLLLCLRHKPEKAMSFLDRCDFSDERDRDTVKDRAKMSALLLYRLIQKGYSSVMVSVMEEEAAERQRKNAAAALQAAHATIQPPPSTETKSDSNPIRSSPTTAAKNQKAAVMASANAASAFQGVFCRDIAVVSNLLSRQAAFNRPLPVKYEALSC